ncbi:MAG: response regulator, partial [Chitinivibrionales bacterium]|nr:response regulator [Chitinivibrionales bacterium]
MMRQPDASDARFLHKTLHVLVVEDNPQMLDAFCGYLEMCPLLVVDSADTADKADAILRSLGAEMHFCVMDLGLPESATGYRLLARYAGSLPFAVVSGRGSMEEASRCRDLGAVTVIDKTDLAAKTLVNLVCGGTIRHKLHTIAGPDEYLRKAVAHLLAREPRTVAEWIRGLVTDESYFRKKWKTRDLQGKAVLYCYQAYRYAFD